MATAQLQLTSAIPEWKLDRRTIEIGRAGVARARQALAEAEPTHGEGLSDEALPSGSSATPGTDGRHHDPNGPSRSRGRRPRISDGQGCLALFTDSRFLAA